MLAGIHRSVFSTLCLLDFAVLNNALQQPVLMSAGWLGSSWGLSEASVIARHEWKGLSKMSYNLEDHVLKERLEAVEREQTARQVQRLAQAHQRRAQGRMMMIPGSFLAEMTDDDS